MKRVVLLICRFFTVFSFAQDAAEKINQANEALKAQDYAKAIELYDDAMNNLGDVQVDDAINFNIGFAAYKAENVEGAVKYFDKAIEQGTNVSKAMNIKQWYTMMQKIIPMQLLLLKKQLRLQKKIQRIWYIMQQLRHIVEICWIKRLNCLENL